MLTCRANMHASRINARNGKNMGSSVTIICDDRNARAED